MGMIRDVLYEANDVLLKLYNLNTTLGSYIKIEEIYDALAINSADQKKEIHYLLNDVLTEAFKYLERYVQGKTPKDKYKISPKGFAFLNESIHRLSPSNEVFCAMWFNSSTNALWHEGIKPAIEKAQLYPFKIDEEYFSEDIIAKMMIHINRSKFVLADLSGQRTAVYYEAGYAQAKGLKVIFTCRKAEEKEINFDVNHYPIVFWEKDSIASFRDKLYSRIIKITA